MRVVTRADFDGLVCAALLQEAGVGEEVTFVHPRDLQDGSFPVCQSDVLANVPHVPGCGLWFDHHCSEEKRADLEGQYEGATRDAPSAARVIYEYYGGEERFGGRFLELMAAVDRADAARFTVDDILDPRGWTLVSFVMDPRTGLGRFGDFAVDNMTLMRRLIDACRTMSADQILALPDVAARVERYFEHDEPFQQMIVERSRTESNVIITDVRGIETIHAGNRFMVYALHPAQNVSVWVSDGKAGMNRAAIAVGHSILRRTCRTNVGGLLLAYGGGGHRAAGTCQVEAGDADRVIDELVDHLKLTG